MFLLSSYCRPGIVLNTVHLSHSLFLTILWVRYYPQWQMRGPEMLSNLSKNMQPGYKHRQSDSRAPTLKYFPICSSLTTRGLASFYIFHWSFSFFFCDLHVCTYNHFSVRIFFNILCILNMWQKILQFIACLLTLPLVVKVFDFYVVRSVNTVLWFQSFVSCLKCFRALPGLWEYSFIFFLICLCL